MHYRDELFARADELMQTAPGLVTVQRISHIDQVRMLREATATLTVAEQAELKQLRFDLMARLDGVRSATASKAREDKPGILGALLRSFNKASSGMSEAIRVNSDFDGTAQATGSSDRLPAPNELLDAAEAWVIATLTTDRLPADADTSLLLAPWLTATVTSG